MGVSRPNSGFPLAYLDPPPFPAPVIVMKDVGGYVSDYQAQTARYRLEGREVRLHECRSACTLALSLPNVCVYPTSLLKFHKAYNANTRAADEAVSGELFRSYPAAVQARLGGLTREYRVLTGAELIALGMRNCNAAGSQMARTRPPAAAPAVSAPGPGLFGSLAAVFAPKREDLAPPPGALRTARTAYNGPSSQPGPDVQTIPLPPRRPVDLAPTPPADAAKPMGMAETAFPGALSASVQVRPQRLD